eukprot:COSAG02_NODE_83629_length_101_cov_125.500000_1_plen_27_part_01
MHETTSEISFATAPYSIGEQGELEKAT